MKKFGNSGGFSLIELLVTMVIAGFIFVGVGGMFQTQMGSSIRNQDETEMQSSTQAVANMISQDIVMAGFGRTAGAPAFVHTNSGGTSIVGDTLTIATAANAGSAISSFLVSGGSTLYNAEVGGEYVVPVRCFGSDGDGLESTGGPTMRIADPTRDAMWVTSATTQLLFVSSFTGLPLANISPNPVMVLPSPDQLDTDGRCWPADGGVDLNNDGFPDPVIKVRVASQVFIPRGTAIYGIRGTGFTSYSMNFTTATLSQNGVPILVGVEDFQLRYFDAAGCVAGCDSLAGINPTTITQVSIGMVVRSMRKDPLHVGDVTPFYQTHDHRLDVTAEMREYTRRQFFFTVRPKNNAL